MAEATAQIKAREAEKIEKVSSVRLDLCEFQFPEERNIIFTHPHVLLDLRLLLLG